MSAGAIGTIVNARARRTACGLLVALLAASAALAGGLIRAPSAHAATADPCARAKALYEAKYYERAEQEYARLLATHAKCATAALIAEAHAKSEAAKALAEAQLDHARRLQAAGFQEEARKLLAATLQEAAPAPGGRLERIDDEVRRLSEELRAPTARTSWWQDFLGLHGPLLVSLAEILAFLLGAIVLVLLTISLAGGLYRRLFKTATRLEGFSGSNEATLGAALTASLSDALERLKDEDPHKSLSYQSGTETKFEIPSAILEGVPQARLLAGLVQMLEALIPRRMNVISATVHPEHPNRGAGLTMLLTDRRGRPISQVTLWEKDFLLKEAGAGVELPVRYERLILPAAMWLAFQPKLGYKSRHPYLGTTDWRSYALFALGEVVPLAAERRVLFERALDRDERNLGARFNLADLLLQRPAYAVPGVAPAPDDGRSETWEERLAAAGRQLAYVRERTSRQHDPIWYRATYMQVILDIYAHQLAVEARNPCDPEELAASARSCLGELQRALDEFRREANLGGLLQAMRQPLQILASTVELIEHGRVTHEPDLSDTWLSASGAYNLACFWSRYAALPPKGMRRAAHEALVAERARRAVIALRRSIEHDRSYAEEARTDPAFDPIRADAGFASVIA